MEGCAEEGCISFIPLVTLLPKFYLNVTYLILKMLDNMPYDIGYSFE